MASEGLDLFDAFGSSQKTPHANLGTPWFEVRGSAPLGQGRAGENTWNVATGRR